MLLKSAVLARVKTGEITLQFRRWTRPTVKAGGQLRSQIGVVDIVSVKRVPRGAITAAEARKAGYETLAALLSDLDARAEGELYRIALKPGGADPRIALRRKTALTAAERADLAARLDRLDVASRAGPWTRATLGAIAEHPGLRAPDLAAAFGRETLAFKRDVRKLKELGLTESLEVGYRLSPRGAAFLKR